MKKEEIEPQKEPPKKNEVKELQDIVNIKKQQSVSNELDALLYEQKEQKEQRERENIIRTLLEKEQMRKILENMSLVDITNLSTLFRLDYLDKRIDFLEKLILKKL